jgi:hypothetical protein
MQTPIYSILLIEKEYGGGDYVRKIKRHLEEK